MVCINNKEEILRKIDEHLKDEEEGYREYTQFMMELDRSIGGETVAGKVGKLISPKRYKHRKYIKRMAKDENKHREYLIKIRKDILKKDECR